MFNIANNENERNGGIGGFGENGTDVPLEIPDADQVEELVLEMTGRELADEHLEDLRASGLSDEAIREARLCSASSEECRRLGFHTSPSLVIPYPGHPGYVRIKPDQPRVDAKGRPIKYETLKGAENHLYMPESSRSHVRGLVGTTAKEILITEGEKKALKADQEEFVTIAVPGVWGWKSPLGSLLELDEIEWDGCAAYIVFDSDVTRKLDVKEAIVALSEHLRDKGADVKVVLLPDIEGLDKTGLIGRGFFRGHFRGISGTGGCSHIGSRGLAFRVA